jgi:hypothetical protein
MRSIILIAALATTSLLGGCSSYDSGRPGNAYRQYDYNRPDPSYGGYDASRYYRDTPEYRERRMGNRDRIYRGNDDRYYCRHSDGSTGLIIGALAGGLLGNSIARGDSRLLGTILGAGAGAAVGSSIDRTDARCR